MTELMTIVTSLGLIIFAALLAYNFYLRLDRRRRRYSRRRNTT